MSTEEFVLQLLEILDTRINGFKESMNKADLHTITQNQLLSFLVKTLIDRSITFYDYFKGIKSYLLSLDEWSGHVSKEYNMFIDGIYLKSDKTSLINEVEVFDKMYEVMDLWEDVMIVWFENSGRG